MQGSNLISRRGKRQGSHVQQVRDIAWTDMSLSNADGNTYQVVCTICHGFSESSSEAKNEVGRHIENQCDAWVFLPFKFPLFPSKWYPLVLQAKYNKTLFLLLMELVKISHF